MHSKTLLDISGLPFGRWLVIGKSRRLPRKTMWFCRCECGTRRWVNGAELRNGKSTNCGCVRRAGVAARNYKHGMGNTRLHARWIGMIARCENPNHRYYANYGGRGIKVCTRWRDSFVAFLEDMGEPPAPRLMIDRIDNDGNYEPGNCRWTTNRENCRNGRHNRVIEHAGLRLTLAQWAERMGIPRQHIYNRINRCGWSVERALTTPIMSHAEAAHLAGKARTARSV